MCGFTKDLESNCDGTHKVVRKVRNKIAEDIRLKVSGDDDIKYRIINIVEDN